MIAEMMGQPDVEEIEGTVATQQTNLRPPEGEVWLIYDLYCKHDDDGAARTCYMFIGDGTTMYRIAMFANLANSTNKHLRADALIQVPTVITRSHYFQWYVDSIGAGKKGYIYAFVYKFKGLPIDTGA